jgi:hypothetical protein
VTQRVVFFVGPDMCGKTQIAQAISRISGIPYFKASSEHDSYLSSKVSKREAFLNQLRYADPRVFDVLKQTGHSLVFDRGFPCEAVYSQVMQRPTDARMLWHMDEMWASLGASVVVCGRSSYAGIADDLDCSIQEGTLQRLHGAYLAFAMQTRCRVMHLNVDDENLGRECDEVLAFLGYSAHQRTMMLLQLTEGTTR